MNKILKTVAIAAPALMIALSAQAATYQIDQAVQLSADGFGSSLFHSQKNGRTSGPTIGHFDDAQGVTSGTWDTSIGGTASNIFFTSSLTDGTSVSAEGRLNESTTRVGGVEGSIQFTITGSSTSWLNGIFDFIFEDRTFADVGSGGPVVANGLLNNQTIGLWGDLGNYDRRTCWVSGNCLGVDLRLNLTEVDSNPAPVPLPMSLGFLLAGLGGLTALNRKRTR
ncbi:MAG: VPLPA-CTERM sorting domain-containing protein [Litoreibacter sp.]